MRLRSCFECKCDCGRIHLVENDHTIFSCDCGRTSIVDFRAKLSMGELQTLLSGLMQKADQVASVIDARRA